MASQDQCFFILLMSTLLKPSGHPICKEGAGVQFYNSLNISLMLS